MALLASKKYAKSKGYFKASAIGKDARFTISKKTLKKIEAIAKQKDYKKSVVVRASIDILFYKAETMGDRQFYKMVHAEYLKQAISIIDLPVTYRQKMLKSLNYLS